MLLHFQVVVEEESCLLRLVVFSRSSKRTVGKFRTYLFVSAQLLQASDKLGEFCVELLWVVDIARVATVIDYKRLNIWHIVE